MNLALGLVFLAVAVVVALFADRPVQQKGGVILKVFSWPTSRASVVKLPIAVALAGIGVWFLLVGVV